MLVSFVFLKAKSRFAKAGIDWETDVIRAIPVSVVPDPDLDEFVSDVSGDEIGAARVTLANAVVNEDAPNDEAELDADDFVHAAVATGETYVGTVLYKQTGGSDATEGVVDIALTASQVCDGIGLHAVVATDVDDGEVEAIATANDLSSPHTVPIGPGISEGAVVLYGLTVEGEGSSTTGLVASGLTALTTEEIDTDFNVYGGMGWEEAGASGSEEGGWSQNDDPAFAAVLVAVATAPASGGGQPVTPEVATATMSALDPTTSPGAAAVAPEVAASILAALDVAAAAGPVTASPDVAEAILTALNISLGATNQEVTPATAAALMSALDAGAAPGAAVLTPDVAAALLEALDVGVSAGSVSVEPSTAIALLVALDPVIGELLVLHLDLAAVAPLELAITATPALQIELTAAAPLSLTVTAEPQE